MDPKKRGQSGKPIGAKRGTKGKSGEFNDSQYDSNTRMIDQGEEAPKSDTKVAMKETVICCFKTKKRKNIDDSSKPLKR